MLSMVFSFSAASFRLVSVLLQVIEENADFHAKRCIHYNGFSVGGSSLL